MMKKSRYTETQIVKILKEVEAGRKNTNRKDLEGSRSRPKGQRSLSRIWHL